MYWGRCVHSLTLLKTENKVRKSRMKMTEIREGGPEQVVSWGPGFRADLAREWDNWRAARGALHAVVTTARARDTAAAFAAATPSLRSQLASYLVNGQLKVTFWPLSRGQSHVPPITWPLQEVFVLAPLTWPAQGLLCLFFPGQSHMASSMCITGSAHMA